MANRFFRINLHGERIHAHAKESEKGNGGDYNLFLTLPDENAIRRYRVYDGTIVTLAQDDHISWPDSISISPDRYLYFTDSQFNRLPYFNKGKDERRSPYKVFRVSKIYPSPP